ncbi:MAG TPA: DUF2892 domain-containing protein [bacterium]|nr:DUF2892 domain-containing protein [bacterium]
MKNVGKTEQRIRFTLAALLLLAGIFLGGTVRLVLWSIALLAALTGAFRFCPLWVPFHINTNKN